MTPVTALVDPVRLTAWAGPRLPGQGGLGVERLAEGHSNLTFTVTREGAGPWILRRPPQGPLLPTAHDVLREARVLDLLDHAGGVRVPVVAVACDDDAVIGAPFYLMERSGGVVVRDELPGWLDEATRRTTGLDLVAALAELHGAAWQPFVEAGVGRESGYVERQLRRWAGQREGIQAAVAAGGGAARELPDYDHVRDWLRARAADLPAQRTALVHGDYKLDNVILDPETGRVAAIVDWEMATVGDPLADLGYLLSSWMQGRDGIPGAPGLGVATAAPGWPTRDELVAAYAAATGRDAVELDAVLPFYTVLAVWKLAVLLEASYYRHLAGTTDDPFFATLVTGVPQLLAHARELTEAPGA